MYHGAAASTERDCMKDTHTHRERERGEMRLHVRVVVGFYMRILFKKKKKTEVVGSAAVAGMSSAPREMMVLRCSPDAREAHSLRAGTKPCSRSIHMALTLPLQKYTSICNARNKLDDRDGL